MYAPSLKYSFIEIGFEPPNKVWISLKDILPEDGKLIKHLYIKNKIISILFIWKNINNY